MRPLRTELLLQILALAATTGCQAAQKVLMKEVQAITLHRDKITTGRRSSPVPQLKRVGGSAGGEHQITTAQCYNRGWDGTDVQWECKASLPNNVELGSIEVVCEGFDYPDDPYILKGSCGLEYTLEYNGKGGHQGGYASGDYHSGHHQSSWGSHNGRSSGFEGLSDLVLLGVAGVVIYALYKTCFGGSYRGDNDQYSRTDDDYGGDNHPGGGGGWFNPGTGRRNDYYGGGGDGGYGASCGGTGARFRGGANAAGAGGAGNFWTGMAAGGLMGYMFGNRGNNYRRGYHDNYYGGNRGYYANQNRGFFGGWGGGGGGGGHGSFGRTATAGGGGSQTRTSTSFGGTRRR